MRNLKRRYPELAVVRTLQILLIGLAAWSCPGSSVTAAEEIGPELIVNGSMEEGNPPVGWPASGVALSADSDSRSGKQSLRLSGLDHTGSTWQTVAVKPNTRYLAELWYKGSEWFGDGYVYIRLENDPKVISKRFSEDIWTRWACEFDTGAASTATIGVYVWWSDYVVIDDVSVTELYPTAAAAAVAKETPADAAVAAEQKQAATETLRGRALARWQALFPKRQYICWAQSPWDKLRRISIPPAGVKECREISLAVGENEHESASFVLTNLSPETRRFAISAKDAGVPLTLREAVWVTSYLGKDVNDALPLLEGQLSIPSGESREVWLTLHSRGVKPGNYRPRVTIASPGMPPSSVNLKVRVHPVSLPDDKPIYTAYWEYLEPTWITPERAQALVDDMKEHYVNTPTVHPWSLMPQPPEDRLKRDYTKLDGVLHYYRQLNPKMIMLNLLSENYLEKMPGFFSEEWKARFRFWLTGLVSHLKEQGFGYDKFALQPYDERLDQPVCDMARLIKAIDPNILVYVNNQGTKAQASAIAPYVDIACPGIDSVDRIYGSHPEDSNQDMTVLAKKPDYFWTYANPMPPLAQSVSPYSWYRMAVWRAWQVGSRGHGYWIYSYKTHWNSYRHEDGENWAVVYFADAEDAPPGISKRELVVTSKRWEATREGVEDYVYLRMLKDRAEKADGKGSAQWLRQAQDVLLTGPKAVLANPGNSGLADAVKERVLRVLAGVSQA